MRRFLSAAAVVAVIIGFAGTAGADITFYEKNFPQQPGESNILFGASQSGTSITGEVAPHTGVLADFTSLTGQTLYQAAKGQADILNFDDPGKANLTSVKMQLEAGYTFGDFIMNPLWGTGDEALVTVLDNYGTFFHTYVLSNGQNYLTIVASAGQSIQWVSIEMVDAGGFLEFKQPRISEVCKAGECVPPEIPVPEPATLLLLGSGLVGVGRFMRRRTR